MHRGLSFEGAILSFKFLVRLNAGIIDPLGKMSCNVSEFPSNGKCLCNILEISGRRGLKSVTSGNFFSLGFALVCSY